MIAGEAHPTRLSAVEWLGRVPSHWRPIRLKYTVLDCRNGVWGDEPNGEDEIVCVRVADFDRTEARVVLHEPTLRSVPAKQRTGRELKRGDLLLEKSGGGAIQPVGAVVLYDHDEPAVCSNFVAKMSPSPGFDARYLCYLHSALYASGINTRSIKQTTGIQNLDSGSYLSELVEIPPEDEQRVLADYLDEKTAAVDALIAKRKRHIELLGEKRRSVIDDLVLAKDASSGQVVISDVPGIGRIPRHWSVVRLKFLGEVRSGITKGRAVKDSDLTEVPYLRVANVQDGYVDLEDVTTIPAIPQEIQRFSLKPGDLLMNEGGDNDKLGRGTVWQGQIDPCLHQNHVFAVRPRRGVNPHWIDLVTQTSYMRHFFLGRAKQSTNLASISATNLKEAPIVMPPAHEQEVIISRVRTEHSRLDRLTRTITGQIDKLREYRQTLISAAVTGQLPVREEVPA